MQDWSEAAAGDLDRRFCMVVPVPRGLADVTPESFRLILTQLAGESLRELQPDVEPLVDAKVYQIGPAVEWSQTFLLVLDSAPEAIGFGIDLIAWAQIVRNVLGRIRKWERDKADMEPPANLRLPVPPPFVTLPTVLGSCLEHFRDNYSDQGDQSKVKMNWHIRTTKAWFGGAGHPSGYETYTVNILAKSELFSYVVDSQCEPVDHFSVKSRRLKPLKLPRWNSLEDDYYQELISAGEKVISCYSQ